MKNKTKKIIGVLLIIGSLLFLFTSHFEQEKTNNNYNKIVTSKIDQEESYYAILKISKINLVRELYRTENLLNNVDQNIMVHGKSTFPGDTPSNVILASHSGTGKNSYFKNLYKLEIGDEINLYYNNTIYEYIVSEIEVLPKTGKLYLKNYNNDIITLITCTKNDDASQTIYYGTLKNQAKIVKN